MICEKCGKEHDGTFGSGRFCSRSCANIRSHSIETKVKISITLGGNGRVKLKNCLFCNKPLNGNQYKYCSLQCSQQAMRKIHSQKQLEYFNTVDCLGYFPDIDVTASGNTISKVRRYLLAKFGHKCQICGQITWLGKPIPLWVDHIDGKADNWLVANLRLVCPNCDFFSTTYCGRNKGNSVRPKRVFKHL